MFAVHAPLTITLSDPRNEDEAPTLINLKTVEGDTSRCQMEIVHADGCTHRLTFNVRGSLISEQFIESDEADGRDQPDRPLHAGDYMVGGRDLRAFDPYRYQPPVNPDSEQRGDVGVGYGAGKDDREARKEAMQASAESARAEREKILNETEEQRAEREKAERDERLKLLDDGHLDTETTGTAEAKAFPNQETQDLVLGKQHGDPAPEPARGENYDPLAPAASSPMPGSPPPASLGQPNPGVVNTTQSMEKEPA